MAKYISDVNGDLTEINAWFEATNAYPTSDSVTTARDNTADAKKIIQTDASGTIDEDLLPRRTILVGGTTGHAGMWAKLGPNGRFDISVMPEGVGAEVTVDASTEAIAAGKFCNLHSGGIRLATNSSKDFDAVGFVLATFASGASTTMYGVSNKNSQLSGMTKGAKQFLGTAGGVTSTAPTSNNSFVQPLGRAESPTAMVFSSAMIGWTKVTTL